MISKIILTLTTLLVCLHSDHVQSTPKSVDPTFYFSDEDWRQIQCLTDNIFFESRSENYWGRLAVGAVTLNRSEIKSVSICHVVYEPYQFSWVLQTSEEQRKLMKYVDRQAYEDIKIMAIQLYIDPHYKYDAGIGNRDHYLAPQVMKRQNRKLPQWFEKCDDKVRINNHIFCEVA